MSTYPAGVRHDCRHCGGFLCWTSKVSWPQTAADTLREATAEHTPFCTSPPGVIR